MEPLTPDQILNEALVREMGAREFYGRLSNQTSVRLVRELLDRLKNEEAKHVSLIQGLIARLHAGKNRV
jgi:rubrerythrin